MKDRQKEIAANWQRADDSLRAACALLNQGFADIAASRAYYAAFYACTAAYVMLRRREQSTNSRNCHAAQD